MKNNSYCIIMAGGVGSRFGPLVAPQNPSNFSISLERDVRYK